MLRLTCGTLLTALLGLQGVDVRHAGIATHYIPSQLLPQVGGC